MSELLIPKRGLLLAVLPIYTRMHPLPRPRADPFGGVRQPIGNQKEFRKLCKKFDPLNIIEAVIMDTYVSLTKAKTSKLIHPTGKGVHGDDDNLRKGISDALVKAKILNDDKQVLGGAMMKFFGPEDLVLIKIYSVSHDQEEISFEI